MDPRPDPGLGNYCGDPLGNNSGDITSQLGNYSGVDNFLPLSGRGRS